MGFLRLVLSFAPWLSFLLIAHGGLDRLILGLAVALALSVVMGAARLHRGVILWVGLTFFSLALVLVAVFHDMWTIRHMGVLANGALALGAWIGVARQKPFTLDYAREHTPEALWSSASFLRGNMIITSVWASAFSTNAVLAWMKMQNLFAPDLAYETASYAILLATALFTQIYPAHAKRRAAPRTCARAAQSGGVLRARLRWRTRPSCSRPAPARRVRIRACGGSRPCWKPSARSRRSAVPMRWRAAKSRNFLRARSHDRSTASRNREGDCETAGAGAS